MEQGFSTLLLEYSLNKYELGDVRFNDGLGGKG